MANRLIRSLQKFCWDQGSFSVGSFSLERFLARPVISNFFWKTVVPAFDAVVVVVVVVALVVDPICLIPGR